MANEQSGIKFFIIQAIVLALIVSPVTPEKDEEESPLLEFAQSLLQESVRNQNGGSGLNVLGGLVQGFMQTEGGKQIGDMLAGNTKGNNGAAELLSNLGTIWQAARKMNNPGGESNKQEASFDPSIIGTMFDLFSSLNKATTDTDNNNVDENNNDGQAQKRSGGRKKNKEEGVDWETMLSFAGNIISSMSNNQQKGKSSGSGNGLESLLSLLPVIMNTMSGQHNIHASHSIPHHVHEQFLPPFLENLHEYWDHFSNSEFGRTLWENSGLADLVKVFTDEKGNFQTEKIFASLENNNFRRRWVRSISSFVAQWVKHFTDPQIQTRYLDTVQVVSNSFLKAQGYPKETLIDLNRPAESISALANAVFKKQFDLSVNSETYVRPAILYLQELFRLGRQKGLGVSKLSSEDIEQKLSETLDSELIEPILRVNRAYKFGSGRKACAKYVICAINQRQDGDSDTSKSGLKPGVTKLASLGAAWFLSGNTRISFWELYNAAVDDKSCSRYDKNCSDFHSEDLKATTEYFHNEL